MIFFNIYYVILFKIGYKNGSIVSLEVFLFDV